MLQKIRISCDQIQLAETILLPKGRSFDDERLSFIKDLSTLDLHAVPGSGKTTALLAKLIALEQNLPLNDRSGILVISHTNAAVNEIRHKIGHYCPRLFGYPNFVGTIQGFIDTFLAVPYYKTIYHRRPIRIDDEIYIENHQPDYKLQAFLGNRGDGKKLLYNYRLRDGDKLMLELTNQPFVFAEKTTTFQKILSIKKQLREDGFLCFDDAYILAQEYLSKFPGVISILRKRFRYVFVDEMQDMDKYQYDILESLFGNASDITYQRIGDKNQAIFNDESEMKDIWQERNVKQLNGSQRLHAKIAPIVQSLALNPINVVGKKVNLDESPIEITPVMLVYNNETISEVLPTFATIINGLINAGQIKPENDNVHKAIAWTTKKPDDKSYAIKLNHYHPSFSKEHIKLNISYPCLESYLFYYENNVNKLASIRKSLLNGILKILRLEKVINIETQRSFTKRTLVDFLKRNHYTTYTSLKLQLYKIVVLTLELKTTEALTQLIKTSEEILAILNSKIKESKKFIALKHVPPTQNSTGRESAENLNHFSKDGINIEITTVHAVKGQTHTSTLYMESFYQIDVGHKGQYESSRVAEQLQGVALPDTAHEFIKQSLKMTYVGFSRPTHLLCFAIHKSRYDLLYAGKPNLNLWDVRELTGISEQQV